jgi:hypothetical protein
MRVLAFLALLAMLGGCATTPPDRGGLETTPVALPADIARLTYPLDAFRISTEEAMVTQRANYDLAQRCVARFGFTLPPRDTGPRETRRRDNYGLADENEARANGYSLDVVDRSREVQWEDRLDQDGQVFGIYQGTTKAGQPVGVPGLPAGGCAGEMFRAIEEGAPPLGDRELVAHLEKQAWNRALDDPRVKTAIESWRQCVGRAGYRYDNALQAPYAYWSARRTAGRTEVTPAQKVDGVPPTPDEVAAALTDVRCKKETGLLQTWVDVEFAHQRVLIEENSERLREYRSFVETCIRNAQRVLAGT